MKITIAYSSKWSVELMDELRIQKVGAMGDLKIKNDNLLTLDKDDNYESIMEKISKTYDNFSYKTISKRTFLGVLARLLGEIRYLDIALQDPEHPINLLEKSIDYRIYDRVLYNEIISLYKKPTEVQSNGGGLANNSNHLMLTNNIWSKILYSIFNMKDLTNLDLFITHVINSNNLVSVANYLTINNFLYTGDIAIHNFIKEHTNHMAIFSSLHKKYTKEKENMLINPNAQFTQDVQDYHNVLTKIAQYTNQNLGANNQFNLNSKTEISLVGLIYYLIVKWAINNGWQAQVDNGKLINQNQVIQGVARTSGQITIKDLYKYWTQSPKKLSWNMPYILDTNMMKKKTAPQINQFNTNVGVGKECGILEIHIKVPVEEAKRLKNQIKNVAVSTFQLGKKGLAYVKEIDIYE